VFKRIIFGVSFFILMSQVIYAQNSKDLKADIYSKIRDYRCTEMTLDKCDCPAAKEMKAYIDAFLETGMSERDILYRVAKKFSLRVIVDQSVKESIEKKLIKETGGNYSRSMFEPPLFNFGQVSKSQGKVSMVSKIYNKGNLDLIITNIRVSCPCVSVSLKTGQEKSEYLGVGGASAGWQAVIAPNRFGELEVVLDLNHSSMSIGKQVREVYISSNDLFEKNTSVKAIIEVKE